MTMRAQARILLVGLLVGVVLLGAQGCEGTAESSPADEGKGGAGPTKVRVEQLNPGTLSEAVVLRGVLHPEHDVMLAAELPGRIESLDLEPGDRVSKGAVLARIDTQMQRAQRDQARAGYDLAVKTHRRLASLQADALTSRQTVDQAEAQVAQARAALRIADVQLRKSAIRSPVDGVVAARMADQGEYVNPGQPVLRVLDLSTLLVQGDVPERSVAALKVGMPAHVRVDAVDREYETEVWRILPAAHSGSRTYAVRLRLPNEDGSMLAGMAASARIVTGVHEQALVVAQDQVVESAAGRAVFVVRDGRAVRVPVTLGPVQDDRVLLVSGPRAGDMVVIEGQRRLSDGQAVEVVRPRAAPDAHGSIHDGPRRDHPTASAPDPKGKAT